MSGSNPGNPRMTEERITVLVRIEDIDSLCLTFSLPVYGESVGFTIEFANLVMEHLNQHFHAFTGTSPFYRHPSADNSSFSFRGVHPAIAAMGKDIFLRELQNFSLTLKESVLNGQPDIPGNVDFVTFLEHGFEVEIMDEGTRRVWCSGIADNDWRYFNGRIPYKLSLRNTSYPMARRLTSDSPSQEVIERAAA